MNPEPYEIQPRETPRKWAIYLKGAGLPILAESMQDLNSLHVEARRLKRDTMMIGGSIYTVADIAHISPWREQ